MSAALTSALATVDNPGQDLARRTVCIKVQRTRLGNSRKVSAAKVEVDTDKTLLRISKRLFDCNEYKAISNFDAEASKYLESVCLPFEKGIHPPGLNQPPHALTRSTMEPPSCLSIRSKKRLTLWMHATVVPIGP